MDRISGVLVAKALFIQCCRRDAGHGWQDRFDCGCCASCSLDGEGYAPHGPDDFHGAFTAAAGME